uniref:LOW QUALITY PROTEIN: tectonic-1-like n=1 Tax=Doryrhamphus excisus TaxID=161450 RepID=UPI0025AE04E2|nr:LOW QUALITY PROTEIN: tectonic-1-like [Doryrhamphus excisus]
MADCVAVVWLGLFSLFTSFASKENTTFNLTNFTTVLYWDVAQNQTFDNFTPTATDLESSTIPNTGSEATVDASLGPSSEPVTERLTAAPTDYGHLPTLVTDVGSVCSCDEHRGICDINCCCDRDCGQELALFTHCSLTTISGNKHFCSDYSAFYDLKDTVEGYSELQSSIQRETCYHAFCIQSQNRVDAFSFPAPALPVDTNFDMLFKQFKKFAFSRQEESTQMPNTFYHYGDVIESVKENGQRGALWLPASGVTVDCVDVSPIAFLVDVKGRCSRRVDLMKACTSLSPLKADTYTKINVFAHKNEDAPIVPVQTTSVVLQSLDGTQQELNLDEQNDINPNLITTPTNVCANVVLKVLYVVTYSVSGQIVSAAVRLLLGHLHAKPLTLEQDFAITFIQENNENVPEQNSGNPGYVLGRPLLSARATPEYPSCTEYVTIIVFKTCMLSLTAVPTGLVRHHGDTVSIHQSSSNHNCMSGAHKRSPVLFGVEATSGCTLRLEDSTNCSLVSQIVLDVLQGHNYPQFVAAFGNSSVNNSLDWVSIQHTYQPTESQACSIPLSLDLQIEWTKYGHLRNPQAQIVSVKQIIQTNTSDLVLLSTGTNAVSIRSSVSFIDVSAAALPGYRAMPTINAKLPADFFFPFV